VTAPPVCDLDLDRMRRERRARLDVAMEQHGADALLLIAGANVRYATSAHPPPAEPARAAAERDVAIVVGGEEWPHLFTAFPERAPDGWPAERLHDRCDTDDPAAVERLVAALPEGSLAADELTPALRAALLAAGRAPSDAAPAVGQARIVKTADELECIRRAQAINEGAMADVYSGLRPGVHTTELAGTFLRRVHELGISHNVVDPVFQVMPPAVAGGPHSVTGDPVYPTPTADRALHAGDVVWVDTGLDLHGLSSDFGRTWIVGREPTARQHDQFRRWKAVLDATLEVTRPGATGADLAAAARAAAGGSTPWLSYFYLLHGTGTASAEMPLVGTDLGPEFDASLVLEPGMVLVLEPVIWDDGHGGYRSEDIFAVTEGGWRALSDFPYTPFGDADDAR
jgi:Xaa-Pro dipeptidase